MPIRRRTGPRTAIDTVPLRLDDWLYAAGMALTVLVAVEV